VIEYRPTVKKTDRCAVEADMILRPFLHSDPVAISYLFGCGRHAACAVVDPVGDIAPYLRVADNTGMRIRFVIDTHIHADHRSAGRALAREAGTEYVLHVGAEVAFPFRAVKDGDRLPLGKKPMPKRISTVATPTALRDTRCGRGRKLCLGTVIIV
jgi:glyoxylase-like metal-dependent hydrolase (beta-lactamase superfamily II)